jgi:hypothetical protein
MVIRQERIDDFDHEGTDSAVTPVDDIGLAGCVRRNFRLLNGSAGTSCMIPCAWLTKNRYRACSSCITAPNDLTEE